MSDHPDLPTTTRELRSTVTADGTLTIDVRDADLPAPGPDQVVVRIEAAGINPSDLALLLGGADVEQAVAAGSVEHPAVTAPITAGLGALAARFDKPMVIGNEGGGVVIAAGSSDEAQALLGKTVGFVSGDAYAEYRTVHVMSCMPMHDGTDPVDAGAPFVNPLTALGMVETMRSEGHTGLVHTVGASNLGQMLNRICLTDGVPLVNIVRKAEHVDMLRGLGAEHVVNSSSDTFSADLADALRATGATIVFDAIGGGDLVGRILGQMEKVAVEGNEYNRYGSDVLKQAYIYGGLDRSPTTLNRTFGLSWSVSGWLLTPFLAKLGLEGVGRLRQRVADEITTTFASSYGMRLTLDEAVDPEMVRRYAKMATGDKALITPHS
ncbi:MAG: NADPH:quinone reductase-like Zn-dependent oxidoreductase [Ilumatobacter sp.]|jgi:NADPH2:quinone reductase